MTTRVNIKLNDAVIDAVADDPGIADALVDVADEINFETRTTTARSARLKPFGERMVAGTVEGGARVGTTWGPAVPVEFGTIDSPPGRVLTAAAERVAKNRGGRLEVGR